MLKNLKEEVDKITKELIDKLPSAIGSLIRRKLEPYYDRVLEVNFLKDFSQKLKQMEDHERIPIEMTIYYLWAFLGDKISDKNFLGKVFKDVYGDAASETMKRMLNGVPQIVSNAPQLVSPETKEVFESSDLWTILLQLDQQETGEFIDWMGTLEEEKRKECIPFLATREKEDIKNLLKLENSQRSAFVDLWIIGKPEKKKGFGKLKNVLSNEVGIFQEKLKKYVDEHQGRKT